MPEGPELYLSSQFVNRVCNGRIFGGKIVKSDVSRQPQVDWESASYTITAVSRGKEIKLTLKPVKTEQSAKHYDEGIDILFQFGMSGKFDLYEANDMSEVQKHAHLNFFTKQVKNEPRMVLSFIDYRRFGKWTVTGNWTADRGPCVLLEYDLFRKNVLSHLEDSAFNRAICETLLNQKFFNGIGNYLRAEILYRLGIPPFVSARSVLEPLAGSEQENSEKPTVKVKSEKSDILQMCNLLPWEVVSLEGSWYNKDSVEEGGESAFSQWLQCYYQQGMKNLADHNKRTIWFAGNPGPMAPKDGKSRAMKISNKKKTEDTKRRKKSNEKDETKIENSSDFEEKPAKKSRTTKAKPEVKTKTGQRKKKSLRLSQVEQDVQENGVDELDKDNEGGDTTMKKSRSSKSSSQTDKVPVTKTTKRSISDLQLAVAVGNKRLTRGQVQSILSNGDVNSEPPRKRTKSDSVKPSLKEVPSITKSRSKKRISKR